MKIGILLNGLISAVNAGLATHGILSGSENYGVTSFQVSVCIAWGLFTIYLIAREAKNN